MSAASNNQYTEKEINPLQSIEQWEDDVLVRYPEEGKPAKVKRRISQL